VSKFTPTLNEQEYDNIFTMGRRPLSYYRKRGSWCLERRSFWSQKQQRGKYRTVKTTVWLGLKMMMVPQTCNKNTARTSERQNCKQTWLAKERGRCKLSSAFWTWLHCESSISRRIVSTCLLHAVWWIRNGKAAFFEMHCFIFNIWKPKTLGGKRSNLWMTLLRYRHLH
jgi:hypothetical protein